MVGRGDVALAVAALRAVPGSGLFVAGRMALIVLASAPAWAKGWAVLGAGVARQPYFTDPSGPLPLPHLFQLFASVGKALAPWALAGAAGAVILSAMLGAGAMTALALGRPASSRAALVAEAWRAAWAHLPAFLRILAVEVVVLGLGWSFFAAGFDRLDVVGRRSLWTGFTLDVVLPAAKVALSALWFAAVGAWGLHTRTLTVVDGRRTVRRTGLLALRVWMRHPWAGPALVMVVSLASVLLSGAVLFAWRQHPAASVGGAWARAVGWWVMLAALAWAWHFLVRASLLLMSRPDLEPLRESPDGPLGIVAAIAAIAGNRTSGTSV